MEPRYRYDRQGHGRRYSSSPQARRAAMRRGAAFPKQSERSNEILYSSLPFGISQSLSYAYRDLEKARSQVELALNDPDYNPPYIDGADKENARDVIWSISVALKKLDDLVEDLLDR